MVSREVAVAFRIQELLESRVLEDDSIRLHSSGPRGQWQPCGGLGPDGKTRSRSIRGRSHAGEAPARLKQGIIPRPGRRPRA